MSDRRVQAWQGLLAEPAPWHSFLGSGAAYLVRSPLRPGVRERGRLKWRFGMRTLRDSLSMARALQ